MVGLVEDGDLDGVEAHEALLHEVFEAAGAGDDDVDAGSQRRDLAALADAAEDRGDVQAERRGERLERRGDLRGELAGRGEHQAARAARAALAAGRRRRGARPAGWRRRGSCREPVRPRPSTSRPARVSGRVSAWIGNGSVMPSRGEDGDERGGHAERGESVVSHECFLGRPGARVG